MCNIWILTQNLACKELEHEGFDAAGLLQSEGFCVQPAHKELVEVLAMASGIAERISVPAKWIRTARHYQLNIYTDNKSYQNPFAFTDG